VNKQQKTKHTKQEYKKAFLFGNDYYKQLLAKIIPERVDAAFAALGYEETTVDGITGYLAVHRKPEEIKSLSRLMALDAVQKQKT